MKYLKVSCCHTWMCLVNLCCFHTWMCLIYLCSDMCSSWSTWIHWTVDSISTRYNKWECIKSNFIFSSFVVWCNSQTIYIWHYATAIFYINVSLFILTIENCEFSLKNSFIKGFERNFTLCQLLYVLYV